MNNNDRGSYRTSKENMMRAFDRLPPEARHALANAVGNWVPQPFLTMYRRHGYTAATLVKFIEFFNARELARLERQRGRAIGPYKGNWPDPDFQKCRSRP